MTAAELLQAIGVYVTNKVGLVRKAELGGKVLKPIVEYFAQKEVEQKAVNKSLQEAVDSKVNKDGSKVLSDENFSTADKNKLDSISENANNYTHPSTHAASMIAESATKRFVSDLEKQTWNAKQNALTIDASLSATSLNPIQNKAVTTKINTVESLAKGRSCARVFDTVAAMTAALKSYSKDELRVGDNIYIKATEVPDYWVSAVLVTNAGTYGYYELSKLEVEKVDLSDYALSSDIPTSLAELNSDSTHRFVSDAQIQSWTSKVSNVSTNLSYTAGATNGKVNSSDGTDAIIPLATSTLAGLLAPSDFGKLSLIELEDSLVKIVNSHNFQVGRKLEVLGGLELNSGSYGVGSDINITTGYPYSINIDSYYIDVNSQSGFNVTAGSSTIGIDSLTLNAGGLFVDFDSFSLTHYETEIGNFSSSYIWLSTGDQRLELSGIAKLQNNSSYVQVNDGSMNINVDNNNYIYWADDFLVLNGANYNMNVSPSGFNLSLNGDTAMNLGSEYSVIVAENITLAGKTTSVGDFETYGDVKLAE